MKFATLSLIALATSSEAFNAPKSFAGLNDKSVKTLPSFDPLNLSTNDVSSAANVNSFDKQAAIMGASMLPILLSPEVSNAAGPDWGLFEGKTGSLLHPIMMFSMAAFSVSTAILGFQWRRQRTMGDEISSLKKGMPSFQGSSLAEAISASEDPSQIAALKAAIPLEKQIAELTAERKELASAGPRDKHFSQGALLAFLGTAFAIEGPLNTYARAGKLFPGPHLYAGAGLVVCWALAGAMVPAMQKGNDTARGVHIGANFLGIGLFGWQVVSGIPILQKVWEKTQWP